MNQTLIESLAQIISSLSTEERKSLDERIHQLVRYSTVPKSSQAELLELEKRLQTFESQYQMLALENHQGVDES